MRCSRKQNESSAALKRSSLRKRSEFSAVRSRFKMSIRRTALRMPDSTHSRAATHRNVTADCFPSSQRGSEREATTIRAHAHEHEHVRFGPVLGPCTCERSHSHAHTRPERSAVAVSFHWGPPNEFRWWFLRTVRRALVSSRFVALSEAVAESKISPTSARYTRSFVLGSKLSVRPGSRAHVRRNCATHISKIKSDSIEKQ